MTCATLSYPPPTCADTYTGTPDRMRTQGVDSLGLAAGFAPRALATLRAFRQAYRKAMRRRRTRQALSELSPRMLRDIGATPRRGKDGSKQAVVGGLTDRSESRPLRH